MTPDAIAAHNAARERIGLAAIHVPGAGSGAVVRPSPIDADRFIRTAELAEASESLARSAPPDIDLVVAIPRSGLIPGGIVAAALHLPLAIVRNGEIVDAGHGVRLDPKPVRPRRVMLIDDTAAHGREMRRRLPAVRDAFPGSEVVRTVAFATPESVRSIDLAFAILPGPHWLEWNWQNAGHGQGCAYDFDGILCRDCTPEEDDDGPRYRRFLETALPLYLPRRSPIHTIVTARHERYRADTIAWLDRHRVSVKHLVMRDWPADHGRTWAAQVGEWKAEHYRRSGQPLMAESCPEQAGLIARLAGKPVLCPASGRVFRPPAEAVAPTPPGPGAWLGWGLHRVGFREAAGCSCAEDAAEMDRIGPDAVLADLEAWTDRLAAKPQAAHVPGRAIRLAIRLACHAAKRSAR